MQSHLSQSIFQSSAQQLHQFAWLTNKQASRFFDLNRDNREQTNSIKQGQSNGMID
jgi:hypothetical protein